MDGLRLITADTATTNPPCCRCGVVGEFWDKLAARPFCPDCQESLARGDGPPLIERTEPHACSVCARAGTVRYLTQPLNASVLLEMDLCPEHFRALLARRLGPFAFHQLSRQLRGLQLTAEQVFLLHDAFYDRHGRALQPVGDEEE
jgi:hypothetical protein